mmetsp:Transcript_57181/g.114707  ORF Transcript_57181/g.114707 Transcript_57181/m.114707 type:complete len:88 (+) Transcript_57181:350-613(+)
MRPSNWASSAMAKGAVKDLFEVGGGFSLSFKDLVRRRLNLELPRSSCEPTRGTPGVPSWDNAGTFGLGNGGGGSLGPAPKESMLCNV